VGALTDPEDRWLHDVYRCRRKVEHRLQLLFDLATHRLPERAEELRKLALRMGYCANSERETQNAEGESSSEVRVPSSALSPQKQPPLHDPSPIPPTDTS